MSVVCTLHFAEVVEAAETVEKPFHRLKDA